VDIFKKCSQFTRAREVQAKGFYPYFVPIASSRGTEVTVGGKRLIMAGSNNYLGLTHHPQVKEAARKALEQYGSSCSGSRFLNGTTELHEELERRLARFLGRDAALCFSTGFQTNLGVLSALCGKDDIVFCDRENHASIFDGCRQSFAELRKYRHGDVADLERLLIAAAERHPDRGKLIVVDGMFSMVGDLADLRSIGALGRKYGARLMVDEAHSVGVLGNHGRGVAEHLGVEHQVDLVVGTFSKSLASLGGFVAGPEAVIHFIKHQARSLIFSAAISPTNSAAALAALDILEREPHRSRAVLAHAKRVRSELRGLGFDTGPDSVSPIVPVILGEQDRTFAFWKALFDLGVFTNPVTAPAVPRGQDLIRTSYMATHTQEQLDEVIAGFAEAGDAVARLERSGSESSI